MGKLWGAISASKVFKEADFLCRIKQCQAKVKLTKLSVKRLNRMFIVKSADFLEYFQHCNFGQVLYLWY